VEIVDEIETALFQFPDAIRGATAFKALRFEMGIS
jgi:hypothetical protein